MGCKNKERTMIRLSYDEIKYIAETLLHTTRAFDSRGVHGHLLDYFNQEVAAADARKAKGA